MTQFRIEVVIDPKRAKPGARKVRKEIDKLEGSAQKLKKTLGQAIGILAVGAGIAAGTRKLADFSQEMSSVKAISQATAIEFENLQAKAQELGSSTRFSATQAAEGMTFLARAGFEADEVLGTIEATLNLAQAGALELGTAADIASNALTAFRLETDQAARVVDVLALAANSSNTTVQQLGDGLKLVAPIAAGLGVEIEETAGAIATLSNAGLQATLAGTGLRRVLSELESPSTKTRKTLKDLGLETEQFKISSVGLTSALKALADAGVDTGLGLEIFGDRGGPAFEVLSSSIGDVERFTASLENANGTAARIAATMDDNLNGSILAAKSAFEGLVLTVGEEGATGALRGFFDITATGLRALTNNINLVATATIGLGAAFAVLRLAPIGAEVLASAAAFVKLRIAVASGKAVILGSVVATKLQAAAEVEAAAATVAKTTADIASATAISAKALIVAGTNETIFIAAAAETQLAAATAANTAATEALVVAQGKLAVATKATTIQMRALALINPFGLAIAGISAAGFGLSKLLDELIKVEEASLRATEAGEKFGLTEFGKAGADITRVQENLRKVMEQIDIDVESKGFANPSAVKTAEKYRKQLERLGVVQDLIKNGTSESVEAANAQVLALERLDVAARGVVASIEQENTLLQENARERQIQTALLQEVAELEKESGEDLLPKQKEAIEIALRRNQVLADQAAAFEAIRGPQAAFEAQVAALQALEDSGRITTEEFNTALGELSQTAEDLDLSALNEAAGGEDIVAKIRAQVEAARALAKAEGDRARILAEIEGPLAGLEARQTIINDLVASGTVTQEQAAAALERTAEAMRQLNPEYAAQTALLEELNGPVERAQERLAALNALNEQGAISAATYATELAKIQEVLNPLNEEQQRQADILADLQQPQEDLTARLLSLEALYESGRISAQAYNKELERMGVAAETSNTALDGLKVGLKNSIDEITDVRGAAQDLVENGFQAAEDAMVSWLRTGEVDFEKFVDSLLDDIARLLVRQALLAAFGGGSAAALGGIVAAAHGGDVPGNTDVLVGEEGPEIIHTPAGGGTVTPAGETAARLQGGQQAAPIVNVAPAAVSINNFSDPNDIPAGIESPEGEQSIMNVMRRRRREVNGITG